MITNRFPKRGFSDSAFRTNAVITKNELEKLIKEKSVNKHNYILIDVREPTELQKTGQIPTSINIPLGQLETTLQLNEKDFQKKYGMRLGQNDQLIFSCLAGVRSENACNIAKNQGFNNVKNYKGSATEWFNL